MKTEDAEVGNLVRVHCLRSPQGLMAGPSHIHNRRHDARGIIISVQADGETLVWVRHGGKVAPYWSSELELLGEKTR